MVRGGPAVPPPRTFAGSQARPKRPVVHRNFLFPNPLAEEGRSMDESYTYSVVATQVVGQGLGI